MEENGLNTERDFTEDFFDHMSSELREAVFTTDVCKRFLVERKRIGELISAAIEAGKIGDDAALADEIYQFEQLQNELERTIADCEYDLFYKEEFGIDAVEKEKQRSDEGMK